MALTRDKLIQYLQDEQGIDPADLADNVLLFSGGLLDSFSMLDLIVFIETEAGIRLAATEVNLDNLDSVERILRFVGERVASGVGA